MTKLEQLINDLCPNGVEYKKLGEVATITRGGNFQKKDFKEQGYPCIHYGQIYTKYGLFVEKTITYLTEDCAKKQKKASKNDVIMAVTSENIEDVCKCVAWLGDEDVAVSGHTAIIHHTLNAKYLVYYLHTNDFFKQKRKLAHGTKVIEVTPDTLKSVKLPVPPLPIQEEIVRILDSFTSLTAELQARQKQYEYYRNQLLEQNLEVQRVPLKTVVKHSCSGGTPKKSNLEYYDNGQIPWIRTQDVKFNEIKEVEGRITEKAIQETSAKWIPENCVIVAISGATAGRCAINKIKATTNQHCLNMEIDETKAYYRYVFHVLCSKQIELSEKKQGARGDLNASLILALIIPLPSLEVQKRLANLLDNFDAICSDLNIGLPAEIEARQKQYEYYRDALLSFGCSHSVNVERERERERERELNKLRQYVFGYVMMPLSKVATCFRGEYITKKSKKPGNVPVILGGQEPAYFIDELNHVGEIVVVARSGASAGFVSYWNEAIFVTDGFGYEADEELMLPKYLFYTLKNKEKQLNAMKRGAGVPHVSGENLASVLLPVPTLKQQKKIVSILDRFETLCNDMTVGLPAEIEARQKQYEYYRDRLLSFPELTR